MAAGADIPESGTEAGFGMVNMLAGGVDGRLMAESQAADVRPEERG
jgi:hypothetical protein